MMDARREDFSPLLVAAGGLGVALACGSAAIEAWRNFWYGMQDGPVYAFGYLIFALGLIVTQVLAKFHGWLRMFVPLGICAIITIWAGLGFYAGRIEDAIRASTTHVEAVGRARKDASLADERVSELQARLTLITEMATSASLRGAQQAAEARAKAEASRERGGCGVKPDSLCKVAEREAAEFGRRAIQAEARETIEAQLDEARRLTDDARARIDAGAPRNAGGAAFVLAWATGGDEGVMRRYAGAAEPLAIIAGQMIMVGLFGPSLWLIGLGLGRAPAQPPAPVEAAPIALRRRRPAAPRLVEPAALPTMPEPEAERPAAHPPLPRLPDADLLPAFIAARLRPDDGGRATFVDIRAELVEWWEAHRPGEVPPSNPAISAALQAAGFEPWRTKDARGYRARLVNGAENAPKSPAGRLALSCPEGDRAQVCHQPAL